ncbi:MAG: rhomboid family intramembrane serine protease [Acidobacteria bacterium]|nr:rhomboid family intramembrane serine protease [Acidobacteriota bacterium]
MIPLRDTIRSRTFPVVNTALIAANVLVFLWQLANTHRLNEIFVLYGIVPLRYADPSVAAHFTLWEQAFPFLSSMFLHGGWFHLLGNLWFLYIFGDNVEERLGHLRYLAFYLLCGFSAGAVHLFTSWGSPIPTLGASGAVSGVMGAYLIFFPAARVLTVVPIFLLFPVFEVPAPFFLVYWLGIQLVSGLFTSAEAGGTAWWAHVGGFGAGLLFGKLLDVLPRVGLDRRLDRRTVRQAPPRLQPLGTPPPGPGDGAGEAVLWLTRREADLGARKWVILPVGQGRRAFWVATPAGVRDGEEIRLHGRTLPPEYASEGFPVRVRVTG